MPSHSRHGLGHGSQREPCFWTCLWSSRTQTNTSVWPAQRTFVVSALSFPAQAPSVLPKCHEQPKTRSSSPRTDKQVPSPSGLVPTSVPQAAPLLHQFLGIPTTYVYGKCYLLSHAFYFFFFLRFVYVKSRVWERKREMKFPNGHRSQAKSLTLPPGLTHRCQGPKSLGHHLLLPWLHYRKWNSRWSIQDWN